LLLLLLWVLSLLPCRPVAMGQQLTCRQCDQCAATCTRERCTQVCLGSRHQPPLVQQVPERTLTRGISEPVPEEDFHPGENYAVAGYECSTVQTVCGDFRVGGGEDPNAEETICDVSECLDQVLPLPEEPAGTDMPNIGSKKLIAALEDECRFNIGKLKKIRHLARSYEHWRPIRGDGNCFYRTVVFGALEYLLAIGDERRVLRLAAAFQQVHYEMPADQLAHEEMLRKLESWSSLDQLEEWVVSTDSGIDQALIRACRRLVRLFLIRHANLKTPNGLTYSELVRAIDTAYTNVEEFCRRVVDPMGRDAETLALDALPQQLGVGLRLWILDRRDEVGLASIDMPVDGQVDVHVLFKPGHYDLLYPRGDGAPGGGGGEEGIDGRGGIAGVAV